MSLAITTLLVFVIYPIKLMCAAFLTVSGIFSISASKTLDGLLPRQRLHIHSFIELLSKQLW